MTDRKVIVIDVGYIMHRAIFAYMQNQNIPPTYTFMRMCIANLKRVDVKFEDLVIMAQDYMKSWRKQVDPCLTGDTEILTTHGWLTIKNIVEDKPKLKIATLNNKTKQVEYQSIKKWYQYYHKGEVYQFGGHSGSRIDIITTPLHKNYVANKEIKKFSLKTSQEMLNYPYLFNRDFKYCQSKDVKEYKIPMLKTETTTCRQKGIKQITIFEYPERTIPMNDWLKLFGWYITEGCIASRTNRKNIYKITISQSEIHNPKYVKNIRKILSKLGINWTESKRKNGLISFDISDTQLANHLAQYGKSHYKYIDRVLLNELSVRQCKVLLKYMLKGDGHKRGFNNYTYTTSSKQLADDIQELALKGGFSATISKKYRNLKTRSEFYFVYIHKIPNVEASKELIKYWEGYTYDIEVPNHIFYIRRNGKCLWTGNCYKAQRKEFRESKQSPEWWKSVYNQFNVFFEQLEPTINWVFLKKLHMEADDWASVACRVFSENPVILISSDRDWEMLCAYDNVKIFSPLSKKFKEVKSPMKVLLEKIQGDKSDNLLEKPSSEAEYEKRKKIVNLLELPDEIEVALTEQFNEIPIKNLYINKIPFNSIRQELKKLYNLT